MARATAEQVNNACIIIDGEEWRDVVGYENIYQISNFGRVKHLPTTVIEVSSSGEVITSRATKEYILKQYQNNQTYSHVGLVKNVLDLYFTFYFELSAAISSGERFANSSFIRALTASMSGSTSAVNTTSCLSLQFLP